MTWRVPPYDRALAEVIAHARAAFRPLGIVVSGSIVRGEAGPTSDLDVFVVHGEPWRLREQRRFAGVPAELFVNPPAQVRRYFASEHAEGRPCTAHMFATGEVVLPHAAIDELVDEARGWLARPLAFTPAQLAGQRYIAVDLLDDARDTIQSDPAAAHLLLASAVERIIAHAFLSRGRFQPRRKRAIADLADLDPVAATLVRRFAGCAGPAALAAAEELARRVLGADTFFEWSSDPDPVPVA
jgi:hypothetical protein